jgi:outer membrane protein OmpA-like peptidoglycan-associated protein
LKKKWTVLTLAAVFLMVSLPALAGVSFNGTRGLIRTRTADTIGKGKLNFQILGHYYQSSDSLRALYYNFDDGLAGDTTVNYHFVISRVGLTYGLNDYFEVGANLSIRNWIRRPDNKGNHVDLETFTRGGLGDTDVLGKICIPLPTPHLKLAALGGATFSSGSSDRGFSTNSTDFFLEGLTTVDFTEMDSFVPTRLHLNAGYKWNRNEDYGYGIFWSEKPDSSGFWPPGYPRVPGGESNSYNDAFHFNTAIEFPSPQVTFFVEFDWEQLFNVDAHADLDSTSRVLPYDPDHYSKSTLMLTPGLALVSKNGTELKAAVDINLNSGDKPAFSSAPDWGVWVALSHTGTIIPKDTDKDGIKDNVDQCPEQPEDLDGYQDDDGCPDLDNDGDGIPDLEDKCPDLAEDVDGFEDLDGCPDLDNDQDGIADVDDRCPNEPEDFDGEEDQDGCPDLVKDSDNDSVPDDIDRCPLQAEDVDGFQDEDGCPDLDNDLDGIPDVDDKCPNAPETFNGYDDEDGCPDEKPIEKEFILKGVHFESSSAALTPDSYPVLDEVIRSLLAYPEVNVEIRGYTDSQGPASFNLDLSGRRADSVKQYLVNAGIDPARVVTKGFGEADPIADNNSPQGRAQNRRIEFRRLN